MKLRTLALLLILMMTTSLLFACSPHEIEQKLDNMENSLEQQIDQAENIAEGTVKPNGDIPANFTPTISMEESKTIALKHAGLTSDQVTGLHADLDFDDGNPYYEVHFHQNNWEYEYEIHADTGEVISFEKDN